MAQEEKKVAKYRVFKQDPISNQYVDLGWSEGGNQRAAIKPHRVEGIWFFTVPERSFHPVQPGKQIVESWTYKDGDDEVLVVEESEVEEVDGEA